MAIKKGFFFSIDSLIALFIVALAIVSVSYMYIDEKPNQQLYFVSGDMAELLGSTPIGQINNSYAEELINNGIIEDENIPANEAIALLWATGKNETAENLSREIITKFELPGYGISFVLDGETIYSNEEEIKNDLISQRTLITGVEQDKHIEGIASRVSFIGEETEHKRDMFQHFGGYIGQGDLNYSIRLPNDYETENFVSAELKAAIAGNFTIEVNGNTCGSERTGDPDDKVNTWNINCSDLFKPNNNKIGLKFETQVEYSYIAGGFINIQYYTDTIQEGEMGKKRYKFPELDGLINIYDSISAQGNITNIKANLTYYSEYDTFLSLGNKTLFYESGKNETQNIQLNENLSEPKMQFPLRFGTENITNVTFETQGKPADVYLVTDVSGSMSNFMDETKVAAKLFVDKIFNQSMDHGVGLASFQRNSYFDHGLSNDVDSLKQTIDDYTSGGMTCTCCGLNRGRNYVMSADDREKSIVLFSDGAPNYNCNGDLNNYYGSGFPWWTDKHAKQDAYASSDEACENDVNVYSIGYGDLLNEQEHQVLEKLACNESMYYRTTDEAELAQIFENISSRILLEANYSGQKIEFTGNLTNSKIYEDSYIDIYYEPNPDAEEVKHGEMPLDLRHNFEGCELDVYIPSEIGLQDAYVNSFSGNNWTKKLKVNGETVYDLDKYGRKYTFLGDPFQIKVPIDSLNAGEINNIKLEVGNEGNETDCSEFNSFIYTGMIDIIGATTPYSSVLPEASGCKWKIENYFGKNETIRVPPDYEGGNNCFYTNSSRGEEYFNEQDSYDVAMYNLLNYLDFNDDGRLSLSFESSDLEIDAHTIDQIPYLLGPMIAEVRVWK